MKRKKNFYLAVFFGTIGLIASDTFIPSIPTIAEHFDTSISFIQNSITVFMLGFCLARFFVSVLSDGLGRRLMFILCFALLFLGSCVCLLSPNQYLFIVGRLLQGVGAGGSNVLARVIIRDITENSELAKYNAKYSMFAVTFMVAAPFIGSLLQTYFNWQSIFIFLASLSIIAFLISIVIYQETNNFKHLSHIKFNTMKMNFIRLFKTSNSIRYASLLFVSFGFMTAWLASGSVILQERLHLSYIEFGYSALFIGIFYFSSSLISSKYVRRIGERYFIRLGTQLFILPPLILAFIFLSYSDSLSTFLIILSVAVGFFAAGFIIPNAYSLGVKEFSEIAGMAGAFFGFAQMFGGFAYSFMIACLNSYSTFPLWGTMVITFLIAQLAIAPFFVNFYNRSNTGL
jgi:DHA1 family bicyclomycin/chloramphenicol resistance-like MFS transporter